MICARTGSMSVIRCRPMRGHHGDECPGSECTGCLPAQAEHGRLCNPCSQRLRDALGARESPDGPHGLGWVHEWLYEALEPSGGLTPGSSVPGPRLPIRESVLDTYLLIANVVRSWTDAAAENMSLLGPVLNASSRNESATVRRCTTWLLRHIESIEAWSAIPDMTDELLRLMIDAHALAPWRTQVEHIRWLPCRICDRRALHDHGDPELICWECGDRMPKTAVQAWAKLVAAHYAHHGRQGEAS